MIDTAQLTQTFRRPAIILPVVGGLVIMILWLSVWFLPQGSKLSKLNTQVSTLQQQEQKLETQLNQLRHINVSALTRLHNQYSKAVPATIDNTDYLNQISAIIKQSGVQSPTFTPGNAESQRLNQTGSSATPIPVSLQTKGTYDQEVKLMQLIYKLPRLTVIDNMTITGGGTKTTRGSILTVTLNMTIFDAAPISGITTPTTVVGG